MIRQVHGCLQENRRVLHKNAPKCIWVWTMSVEKNGGPTLSYLIHARNSSTTLLHLPFWCYLVGFNYVFDLNNVVAPSMTVFCVAWTGVLLMPYLWYLALNGKDSFSQSIVSTLNFTLVSIILSMDIKVWPQKAVQIDEDRPLFHFCGLMKMYSGNLNWHPSLAGILLS